MTRAAQDPRERFDVVAPDGRPTAATKARGLVHRDGDWHRAVHLWVAGRDDDGPFLLLQRRSAAKDTWPGALDVTVGGHLRAGETVEDALREADEEIGLAVAPGAVRRLGRRRSVHVEADRGVVDREVQEVLLVRDDRRLGGYRPDRVELAALVRFPLGGLAALLDGRSAVVPGLALAPGAIEAEVVPCRREDLAAVPHDYLRAVVAAAAALLAGEEPEPLR